MYSKYAQVKLKYSSGNGMYSLYARIHYSLKDVHIYMYICPILCKNQFASPYSLTQL